METKKGHRVHVIEGDAAGIQRRGTEIEDLGDQMTAAADILREIGDGATEEKGRSIERIRDEVGDVHEELRRAGERYGPTGNAMHRYGSRLGSIQAAMRTIVEDAEAAKRVLDSKRTAAETAQSNLEAAPMPQPGDPADADRDRLEQSVTDANGDVVTAQRELDGHLDAFDTQWTLWDEAYDEALGAINDATSGNVTDDWTDDLAGVVEVVVDVLSVVGLIVGIAALIIGGPLIALIGAVVGVLALIGTAYLFWKGRKGGADLAFAIIGVLPFGKLGKLFQSGQRMQALAFFKGPVGDIMESVGQIRGLRGVIRNIDSLGSGHGLGQAARAGLAARVGPTFQMFRWQGYGVQGVLGNLTGGVSGAWSRRLATEFVEFSSHHQSIIRGQLGSIGAIENIIDNGAAALPRAEQVANATDMLLKTGIAGNDAWGVAGPLIGSDPVDTWRAELAR